MTLIIKELPLVGAQRLSQLLLQFADHSKNFVLASVKTDELRYKLVYSFTDALRQYNLLAGYDGLNIFSMDELHEIQDNIMLELCRFLEPEIVYSLMLNLNNIGIGSDIPMSDLFDHMMYLTENEAEAVVIANAFVIDYDTFKQLRQDRFEAYREAIDTTESWIHSWMKKYTDLPKYLGV